MFNSTAVAANAARLIQQWINDGTYPAGSLLPS
ncbi:UNVERIFIED_CONTAM: FadR family transcriptional regulator, partial [Salmonella enterica subsp. enterica serovar Weltevreden]